MNPNQVHANMPRNAVPVPVTASGISNMAMHVGPVGPLTQQAPPEQMQQPMVQQIPPELNQAPIFEQSISSNFGQPTLQTYEQQMPHQMEHSTSQDLGQPMPHQRSVAMPHQRTVTMPQQVGQPIMHTLSQPTPQQVAQPILQQQLNQRIAQETDPPIVQRQQISEPTLHQNGQPILRQSRGPLVQTPPTPELNQRSFSNSQQTMQSTNHPTDQPILQHRLTRPLHEYIWQPVSQHRTIASQRPSHIGRYALPQAGQPFPQQGQQMQQPTPEPSGAPTPMVPMQPTSQDQTDNISRAKNVLPSLRDAVARTAASSTEQAHSASQYLPQTVTTTASDTTHSRDTVTSFSEYTVTLLVQVAHARDVHDTLMTASRSSTLSAQ